MPEVLTLLDMRVAVTCRAGCRGGDKLRGAEGRGGGVGRREGAGSAGETRERENTYLLSLKPYGQSLVCSVHAPV